MITSLDALGDFKQIWRGLMGRQIVPESYVTHGKSVGTFAFGCQ